MIEHAGEASGHRTSALAVELWDSFADNVAGVVLDAADLDEQTMRAVAAELGAPTTGFVVALEPGPPPAVSVRYFTPVQEIDACGHVTVAAFSALAKTGHLTTDEGDGGGRVETLLHAAAGESRVLVRPEQDGSAAVEMFQDRAQHAPSPLGPDEVEDLLGVPSDPSLPAKVSSTGLRHLVVPYPDPEDLGRLRPDFAGLAAFGREAGVDTVCAFAPEVAGEAQGGAVDRVRARDICSPIGADEEPASGATSGALACYLFRHGLAAPAAQGATVTVSVLGRATRTLTGVLELPGR